MRQRKAKTKRPSRAANPFSSPGAPSSGAASPGALDTVTANPAPASIVRVGPAGWSYPDWAGYVYPPRRAKGFHEAAYLAEFFDTIEINTSFYQPLRPDHAAQWIERVAANPRFVFTAKLWQRFTHDVRSVTSDPPQRMSEPFAPASMYFAPQINSAPCCCNSLFVSSLCGNYCVPLGGVETLLRLSAGGRSAPRFMGCTRDAGIAAHQRRQFLQHRSAHDRSIPGAVGSGYRGRRICTASRAALRHVVQRRCDNPAHERYNYLYTAEELAPWVTRVHKVTERARETFVITNNHFQGKAVVNALQLISILKESKVKVPEPLRRQYPQLESIADSPPAEPMLFPLGKGGNDVGR